MDEELLENDDGWIYSFVDDDGVNDCCWLSKHGNVKHGNDDISLLLADKAELLLLLL